MTDLLAWVVACWLLMALIAPASAGRTLARLVHAYLDERRKLATPAAPRKEQNR